MEHPQGMVRAVAEARDDTSRTMCPRYRYVSVIRFANCYSVTLSNDPEGYAGGNAARLSCGQSLSLGKASGIFNRLAAL